MGENKKLTFLFLYSEIMPYNLACFRAMRDIHHVTFHVIRWDKKTLTPYVPLDEEDIRFYNRSDFTVDRIKGRIDELQPDLVYIVGRMDDGYLQAARYARSKKIITVSGWDNQWQGTIRHRIACLLSRWLYKPYFDYIMVAGIWQYEYVRRLGYARNRIVFDAYSCDVEQFESAYEQRKQRGFPNGKKILFVGRFTEIKGIMMLAEVFQQLRKDGFSEWRLMIIGNGPLETQLRQMEGIEVIPFSGQNEMASRMTDVSFFCLPSFVEPWGVVIHEMAVAGIPLVVSDVCGASTVFVKKGYNGVLCKSQNANALKRALSDMMKLNDEERIAMCYHSHTLGHLINPTSWSYNLLSILK